MISVHCIKKETINLWWFIHMTSDQEVESVLEPGSYPWGAISANEVPPFKGSSAIKINVACWVKAFRPQV